MPRNDLTVVLSFGTDMSRILQILAGSGLMSLLYPHNLMLVFLISNLDEKNISPFLVVTAIRFRKLALWFASFLPWTTT